MTQGVNKDWPGPPGIRLTRTWTSYFASRQWIAGIHAALR